MAKKKRRWQDDQEFVAFLKRMKYFGHLSDGLYLYMWEAWNAAKETVR